MLSPALTRCSGALQRLLAPCCCCLSSLSLALGLAVPPSHSLQVLGHSKTILVLLGGWLFLGDAATSRKLLGMGLAVAGMIW